MTSLTFTVAVDHLLTDYVAARRGDSIAIIISAALTPRRREASLLLALTDEECEQYELGLPVAEQQRRLEVSWAWRGLSRRRAMLVWLGSVSDAEFEGCQEVAAFA